MSTIISGWASPEPEPPKEEVDWDLYLGPAAWRPFNRGLLDGFNFEKGGGLVGGGCPGMGLALRGPLPVGRRRRSHGAGRIQPAGKRPVDRPLRQRRQAGPPQRRLAAAGLVPGAVRRRHGLGRGGRQRQARAEFAGAAGREKGRRDRRLPGHVPRPRFPGLRQVARPAARQRRRRPATRTSPAMPPTSRSFWAARSSTT